jgi:peptidyl-prolyl cis-trans isomerase C
VIKRLSIVVLLLVSVACQKSAPAKGTDTKTAPGTAAAGSPGAPAQPAPPKPVPAQLPQVLARVNGESIEKPEFDIAVKNLEARARAPIPTERRDEILRQVLDNLVNYHLLAQESRSRGVAVPDAEIDGRIQQIQQQFPNPDAFKKALEERGMTVDRLKQETRTGLMVSRMMEQEVGSKISVQEKDISDFYGKNKERFKQGEAVHVDHILIRVPENADPPTKAKAKAQASAILRQVRAGGDFGTLARKNSQDPGSAAQGGDLGFVEHGQTVPPFEQAAFALAKPGDVSDVVESGFGFHIIKLVAKRAPRDLPLTEVSDQIKQFLTQQQQEEKSQAFIEHLKSKGKVEILI